VHGRTASAAFDAFDPEPTQPGSKCRSAASPCCSTNCYAPTLAWGQRMQLRRRGFITLLGGAAAWPLGARAQQPAVPVIGFLNPTTPEALAEPMRGLRQGLKDAGYVEGENLIIEYRWADNQGERLPAMAAELVRRGVSLIVATGGGQAPLAAKAATTALPIVFNTADDPVSLGLVASLAQPGGNVTGVSILSTELTAKRLELLHALVPSAIRITALINPGEPAGDFALRELEAAGSTIGLQTRILRTSTDREIDAAFASFMHERPDALFAVGSSLFLNRRVQLCLLAAFHHLPAIFSLRELAEAGGLMSYGASLRDAYRQVGVYAGRILRGAKPADLPVVQSSKFDLVINHQTARMLGLTVPPSLLATADEVIE
jgi:putative tryptophan/tyrosine transport system substrate-binding protein